jgi:hypothetical protein
MTKHNNSGTILQFRRPDREAIHKEQLTLDAYNALVAGLGEPCMPTILFPVPNGTISVTISHPEVTTPRVAWEALALIRQGIQENGIPKDPMVGLTGANMRGAEQKSSEVKKDTARVHRRGGERSPPQMKGIKKDPEIQKQQRPVDELSDEELETELAECRDSHVIVVNVPKGFVSAHIFGTEVTPAVAISALALISAVIRESGIPKEKLVQLGGCVNIGQKQKA